MRWLVFVSWALLLGGCSVKQAPAPPPLKLAVEAAPASENSPSSPTAAQILTAQPPEVRNALKKHGQSGKWPVYKTTGYILYPYGEGQEPVVNCAPLRTTDLQLQSGETITDVAMGDTERWMATPASSGDPRNPLPHLAVKPQQAGIETNLTIYTTKHIYHLLLSSHGPAMQEVEFYYPEEVLAAMREADVEAPKAKEDTALDVSRDDNAGGVVTIAAVDPAQLNFSYTISGPNVPWKPLRAFDDDTHVYLQMSSGMKASDAPALLIAASGGTQMVNYRIRGNYYIVDRLFNQAILVSGVGREQDRVTIAYAGGMR